jgi:hypothetical protein
MPKWFVIARNEYRIITSSVRKIRAMLPILLIVIFAVLILTFIPRIVEMFVDEIEAFFFSIIAVVVIQIILFILFFYFLTFPISLALRDVKSDQNEVFLSSPIKPSDVLLGKFLGVVPFYAIGITVIACIFLAVIDPLGLDIVQVIIIILIFILICLSGLWIGTVITAFLRTKLGETARGRDIGKALAIIIALPMIAAMYAFMGGGLFEALANPNTNDTVKMFLRIFPSSWGGELIIDFVLHPGDLGSVWLETITKFGGLVAFFFITLWVGTKVAGRVYSLEQTSFYGSTAKPDGGFYRAIKKLGGGDSFGTLLVTMFKDYGRRLQNITWIVYIIGIIALILIFLSDYSEPMDVVLISQFVFALLAAVVVGDVTIRGKDNLFIYRKSPNGENRFVKARLIQSLLVVVPIVFTITVISLLLIPNITIFQLLAYTGYTSLVAAAFTAFALGLFLLKPAFSETSAEFMANIMIVSMIGSTMFIFLLILLGILIAMIAFICIIWLVGITLLVFGKMNLSRIE